MVAGSPFYVALHHDAGKRRPRAAVAPGSHRDGPYNALMSLKICLIASEVAPFSKTGGLADVSAALTKYLHAAGHEVRLFTPLYSAIDSAHMEAHPAADLQDVPLACGSHQYRYSVLTAAAPQTSAGIYFIDCPALYA